MKLRISLLITILFALTSITAISLAQRPLTDKPITGDFKITIRQTMGQGQEMTSTTMIKGMRERSEMSMPGMPAGMGMTTITECDLKRTIRINDNARKYMIEPMDTGEGEAPPASSGPVSGGPSRRGGVLTVTMNTVDTGERKDMFGFTARHMRQTMMMESSADACNPNNMKMERDGWYINLEYGLNCGPDRPPQAPSRMPTGGCRDTYRYKRTGAANLGYPLMETIKMYGADGSLTMTMSKEVIELSRQSLDAALFDVPAGYTQANNSQEMYSFSMGDAMNMAHQQEGNQGGTQTSNMSSNRPGNMSNPAAARPKVGIVEFNNKAKASVSTDELRQQLIATLSGNGIDAVALNASSASEVAMEAKAKGCAYILFTDISTFKAPSTGKKLGGMLGGAVGIGGGGSGKAEAKFDYRLVPAAGGSAKLQSSASAKEDTSDASANAALQEEARAVTAALGGQ
jgi:hypothetical protein